MNETLLLGVVIVVLLVVVGWLLYERRRSAELRSTFGPEYQRTVRDTGDRRAAEQELRQRQERVDALDIRPLPAGERDRYARDWRAIQARFVDEPPTAIADADGLIRRVMEARGYPVGDFEQQAADVSVNHAGVVEHYRAAHEIAARGDQADTEDLRQAMVHERALFDELLGPDDGRSSDAANRDAADTTEPELTRRAS